MKVFSRFLKPKGEVEEETEAPKKKTSPTLWEVISTAVAKKTYKSEKFKQLPEKAIRLALAAQLEEKEILENWEIFLCCLYVEDREMLPSELIPEWTTVPRLKTPSKSSNDIIIAPPISNSKAEKSSPDIKTKCLELIPSSLSTTSPPNKKKKISRQEADNMVQPTNPRDLFTKTTELGRGSFGTVYLATEKLSKKSVALKYLNLNWDNKDDRVQIINEVYLLGQCKHQNVVHFLAAYRHNNKIWISMEYCDGGTLEELLSVPMSESLISFVLKQVIEGVGYLHSQDRIHRDVKSSNILLNKDGCVKIADLGLSIMGAGQLHKGFAGSKLWVAPEVIQRVKYTEKIDIWSIGAVAFEMAEGHPPYDALPSLKALFFTATKGRDQLRKPNGFSAEFHDILDVCMQIDVCSRPSAQQLLQHSFLKLECTLEEITSALRSVFLLRVTSGL